MATYNRAQLITKALKSIQNQVFENWECLIIDDGSTDQTSEVVLEFIKEDTRFRYKSRPSNYKKGLPGCRNYGLDIAKGNYIIFFDDDDIIHPLNLEISLAVLEKYRLGFCKYEKQSFEKIDEIPKFDISKDFKVNILKEEDLYDIITNRIAFASCTVLWSREYFNEERFDESLMYAEEWELYIRMLNTKISGCTIDKTLYFNRKHRNSNTGAFWRKDSIQVNSKKKAVKKVVDNLSQKDRLNPLLTRYFIQLGILLKDSSIIDYVLSKENANVYKKIKYHILYRLYPFITMYMKIKKKLGRT